MDVHHIFVLHGLLHVHVSFDDHSMFYRTAIMAIVSPLFVASVASLTLAMPTVLDHLDKV